MYKIIIAIMVSFSAFASASTTTQLQCSINVKGNLKKLVFNFDTESLEIKYDELFEGVRFTGRIQPANFPNSDAIIGRLSIFKGAGRSSSTFIGSPNLVSGSVAIIDNGEVYSETCTLEKP